VIENGFDEESFSSLSSQPTKRQPGNRAVTLLHSGFIYPLERDPTQLFAALANRRRGVAADGIAIRIAFRSSGNDALLKAIAEQQGVSDLIDLLPPVSYLPALEEMISADGLLLLQGDASDQAIPAKLYEYLRAGRPILALTSESGDTAQILRSAGLNAISPLSDALKIEAALNVFASEIVSGSAPLASSSYVRSCSRSMRAKDLAALLARI
jgi:hypothetical protein